MTLPLISALPAGRAEMSSASSRRHTAVVDAFTEDIHMATFVLIHGAGSDSFYWHRVRPELEASGHDVVAPDLPCDDDRAGLAEYTDVVIDAIGDRFDLVLVAQSMAGCTAPLVCQRLVAQVVSRGARARSEMPFDKPWPLDRWPDVPTRFLLCCGDRFFPAEFLHRVVRDRLGITPDEMDGGHLPAFSRPIDLAGRLDAYLNMEEAS